MTKWMIGLVLMAGSSAFAITASEMGKQYFPQYKPVKSDHCEALKIRFSYDKTSSFAGYTVNMPMYLALQPFEASIDLAQNVPQKESKRYGLDIMSLDSDRLDSDFAVVNFYSDFSNNKQSMSLYFDRLEKYKTGVCIRVYT